jgi:hypothetical protein
MVIFAGALTASLVLAGPPWPRLRGGLGVVRMVDVAMAEAGETQPTRQRFLDSHAFALFVRNGFGTQSAFDAATAAVSYFDDNFQQFRINERETSTILDGFMESMAAAEQRRIENERRLSWIQDATDIFEVHDDELASAGFGKQRDAIYDMISNLRRHYYEYEITYRDDPEKRAHVAQQILALSHQYGSTLVAMMGDFARQGSPVDDWMSKVVSGIGNQAVHLRRELNPLGISVPGTAQPGKPGDALNQKVMARLSRQGRIETDESGRPRLKRKS